MSSLQSTLRAHAALAEQNPAITGESVAVALVDQGYVGKQPTAGAEQRGTRREVVKLPKAKAALALLPRRRVVECSFTWMARFRRLGRNYERPAASFADLRFVAFGVLTARRFVEFMIQSA